MNLKIIDLARHRNGIDGAPFHVTVFNDGESIKLAVLFEARVERRRVGERSTSSSSSSRVAEKAVVGPPSIPPRTMRDRLASASPASLAAVCGMAFLSGMGLVALLSGRRRRPTLLEVLRESAT